MPWPCGPRPRNCANRSFGVNTFLFVRSAAIGRIGGDYYQNAKTLPEYEAMLGQGSLPVARGLLSSADDRVRRDVIMALMCHGRVDHASIERTHAVRMRTYFAAEFERLVPLAAAGLVELHDDALEVTEAGWYVVRAIAMVFDRYLRADRERTRYSKVI